jgi:hypothetical protein
MQHLLNDPSTVFPAKFYQAIESSSASFETEVLFTLSDVVSELFSGGNQVSYSCLNNFLNGLKTST